MIDKFSILNGAKCFSSGIFQNYLVFTPAIKYGPVNISMLLLKFIHVNLMDFQNVIIFGADMSSSVHVDNKGKDILILGEGPAQGFDNTTLTQAKYSVNFTQSGEKICIKSTL